MSKIKHNPLFEGEKTLEYAKDENKRRIRSLQKVGTDKAKHLIGKLEHCSSNDRCLSPACAICSWFSGRRHVRQMRRILRNRGLKYLVTIVPTGWYFNPSALRQMNVRQLKNTLRKQIQRVGIDNALVIGGIEAEYKFKKDKVSLHWHLIVGACSKEKLESLRQYYLKDRQMRIDAIKKNEASKTYSYCFKNVTYSKVRRNPKFKQCESKRPSPDIHAELMYFLDRHTFRELMFLKGFRFHGDKLKDTRKPVAPKTDGDKRRDF